MDEFRLINEIVDVLGEAARGPSIVIGPGDDAAVVAVTPGHEVVSSIDTFVADVHFPAKAPPADIGYRAFMASTSDLAAMAATPKYALVALTIPEVDQDWVRSLSEGFVDAALSCGMSVCGGNLSRGPLALTISVHGEVPQGKVLARSGASVGEVIQVSGNLGSAAACVRTGMYDTPGIPRRAYFRPQARVDLVSVLRAQASAGIDISDGCLQDLDHILKASHVGATVSSTLIPLGKGASVEDAMWGGDDYQLLVTADTLLQGFHAIGKVTSGRELLLDGEPLEAGGYDHFRA